MNPPAAGPHTRLGPALRLVAPAVVAASGLGVVLLLTAGRALGPARFTTFTAFWSTFFLVGALVGVLEQETSRAVAVAAAGGQRGGAAARQVLGYGGLLAATATGLLAATWPVTGSRLFGGDPALLGLVALGGFGFTAQAVVRGSLIAAGRARPYAGVVVTEAVVRVLPLPLLVAHGVSVRSLAAVTTAGAFGWLLWLPAAWPELVSRGQAGTWPAMAGRCTHLVAGGLCTSALIPGYPALAAALLPGHTAALGVLLAALTVSRVPLVAFAPIQLVLIPAFVRAGTHAGRLLRRAYLTLAALGVPTVAVAWAAGPWGVRLLYGPAYRIGGVQVAALAGSALLLAALLTAAAALVATDRHVWVARAWAGALVAGVVPLGVGGPAWVAIPASLTAAGVAGALLAGIPALRTVAGRDRVHRRDDR